MATARSAESRGALVTITHHDESSLRSRFRFGFACHPDSTPVALRPVQGWSTLRLHGHTLHTHPDVAVRVLHLKDRHAVVIGDVFVAHGESSVDDMVAALVSQGDWDAFDCLSGRFALLTFTDGGVTALNDPFGARTIYYKLTGPALVSSHAALVAEMTGERISPSIKNYTRSTEYLTKRTRFLPGDYTMFSNIVRLAPNNALDLGTRATKRYWPRGRIPETTLSRFHDLADEFFAHYAAFLSRTYSPVLGLTGGVDSRAVLAGLMAHGVRPRLTTWSSLPPDEMARLGPMIRHLGLEHSIMDVKDTTGDNAFEALRDASHVNTGYWRGRSFLAAQSARNAGPHDAFVRGLGGEILRGSYHSSQMPYRGEPLDVFVRLYLTRAVREPTEEHLAFTTRAFEQFMRRANYGHHTFDADAGDLVYWEQRMGMWAADLHNELDPAMMSHTGINSRPLYEAAWGLPDEQRFGKQLLLGLMARYDPTLASM